MAVSISAVTNVDATQNQLIVDGALTLSGNYGGADTHGDTLSFAGFDEIKSSSVPTRVEIFEAPTAGNAPTGYSFVFAPGTTQANGVLQVLQGAAAISEPQAEITAAAAYPAALTAATANIKFRAWFPSFA